MTQFNIAEAKANFSSLVRKAMMGEEVIIAKNNKPLLKLTPIAPENTKRPQPGTGKHEILYIASLFECLKFLELINFERALCIARPDVLLNLRLASIKLHDVLC